MDASGFDRLTKQFVVTRSRRRLLREFVRGGAVAAIASLGINRNPADATYRCREQGCDCDPNVLGFCREELICCRLAQPFQGIEGTCSTYEGCYGRQCSGYGCTCDAGDSRSCGNGLICCPWSFDATNGLGSCFTVDDCYKSDCQGWGEACAHTCGWANTCSLCCSGWCNDDGVCG